MDRVRVLRAVSLMIAIAAAAAAAAALYMTQPVHSPARNVATGTVIAPGKLEAHVRMLSVTLAPRHWEARENLDRAATYVGDQLMRTGARVT